MDVLQPLSDVIRPIMSWIGRSDDAKAGLLLLFLTFFLRIVWLFAASVYRQATEWVSRRIAKCEISLGPIPVPEPRRHRLAKEIPIYCLLVRYGPDEYLEKLASDQEKYEGRLRLEIVQSKLLLDPGSCSYSGVLRLKVHKRLGTQFKLFFEVDNDRDAARYVRQLKSLTDLVAEVSTSGYAAKTKVWFLLKRYHITNVVDGNVRRERETGIRNNFYFPV